MPSYVRVTQSGNHELSSFNTSMQNQQNVQNQLHRRINYIINNASNSLNQYHQHGASTSTATFQNQQQDEDYNNANRQPQQEYHTELHQRVGQDDHDNQREQRQLFLHRQEDQEQDKTSNIGNISEQNSSANVANQHHLHHHHYHHHHHNRVSSPTFPNQIQQHQYQQQQSQQSSIQNTSSVSINRVGGGSSNSTNLRAAPLVEVNEAQSRWQNFGGSRSSQQQQRQQQPQQRINNQMMRAGMSFDQQMQQLFEYFAMRIHNQKEQIKFEREKLKREQNQFVKNMTDAQEQFEVEKQRWDENHKRVSKMLEGQASRFIELDIGGTHKITTSISTLTKVEDSALAAYFSGRHKLHRHNGRVLIDRDGPAFCHVISYLWNGKIPIFVTKAQQIAFRQQIDFWGIPYPTNQLENQTILKFDKSWCASSLKLMGDSRTVDKRDPQHGIVFANLPLDLNNSYIEYQVTMNWVSNGKSHLFVGLVDRSKYQYSNLVSTYWKDSPSSYYWDVWMRKLIKTDEAGTQRGVTTDYGCGCENKQTKIGIYYDAHNRTVSYYKDGINQGVAFRNVSGGYYPSIDIWFDSGKVQILQIKRPPSKQYLQN